MTEMSLEQHRMKIAILYGHLVSKNISLHHEQNVSQHKLTT